jgi:hypothetical protein
MPSFWQKTAISLLRRLRDLALIVLVLGGVQILLALLPWLAFFRRHPQGFSMALSLVGFGGWFVAFASSVGVRRGMSPRDMSPRGAARQQSAPERPSTSSPQAVHPWVGRIRGQIERSGCGTVLFFSSLLPLALAFALRLQADMQSGKTWSDIFPPVP